MANKKSDSRPRRKALKKTLQKASKRAKKVGDKIAHVVAETPELISLKRNERAIHSEIDDHLLAIGKHVRSLHRRARGTAPFERYGTIMEHLVALERLDDEYRENRVRLNLLKEELRGKGK